MRRWRIGICRLLKKHDATGLHFDEEWKMQNHTADTCENKTHPEPTLTMIDVRCAEGEITSLKLRIRCTA
jgi:hypothetical protein